MSNPLLSLKNIHTYYGNIEALKGINININEGEIIALLGANGAGKTTTLNSITGIVPPRTGEITFDGKDIRGLKTENIVSRGLIQVPEGRHIFPDLTVLENLRMGAYLRNDKKGIKDDLEYIFNLFPILATRATQSGGTLSGGEQQMLAISRGLMGKPRMLLLDEPSLGLAPLVIRNIFETIKTINQEQKMTILLVEQNVNLALRVANRGYILTTGLITLSGTATELTNDEGVRKAYLGG